MWIEKLEERDLAAVITDFCNTSGAGLFEGWEKASSSCRKALAYAIAIGRLPPPSLVWQAHRQAYDPSHHFSTEAPEAAKLSLRSYVENAAHFSLLPGERIAEMSTACGNSIECQDLAKEALTFGVETPAS